MATKTKKKVKFVDELPKEKPSLEQLMFERARVSLEVMTANEVMDFLNNHASQYEQQVYLAAEEVGHKRQTILREFPIHPTIRERCKSYAN
jgi:hypothetical protein